MRIAVMEGDRKHLEERIARVTEQCTCGICKQWFSDIWEKYFDPKSPLVRCPNCGDIYQRYSGFMHKCPISKKEEDRIYAIESERRRLADASDEEIEQIMTQRTEKEEETAVE